MPHGGTRPGSGRPPGAKNKRTVAVAQAVERAAATLSEVIPGAFAGDAHGFLMSVYKDPSNPTELRVDAAKAAVRYEKPALSSITATLNNRPAGDLDDADLDRRIALALAQLDDAEDGYRGEDAPPHNPVKPH